MGDDARIIPPQSASVMDKTDQPRLHSMGKGEITFGRIGKLVGMKN